MKRIFSFSFTTKRPSEIGRMIQTMVFVVLVCYSLWIVWIVYDTVAREAFFPSPVDQSQVTAKQGKVNKKLLDEIAERDAARQSVLELVPFSDPFTP